MIINGTTVQITKKRIKNIYLRVLPGGVVTVTAPFHMSEKEIENFVQNHQDWIEKHKEKIMNRQDKEEYAYESGEEHYLWGEKYTLEVIYTKGKKQASLQGDRILLEIPAETAVEQREAVLDELYRRQMQARLPEIIARYSAIVGKSPKSYGIKKMKTRRGTCNTTDGRIWLNLHLAKYNILCLEYVVTHELVHFYEKGHNAAFYGHLDRFFPSWKTIKRALNDGKFDHF